MGVVVELLLAAAAWFGHAFLLTVVLSWWYAQPLRRGLLKGMRLLIFLTVAAFPVIVAWRFAGQLREFWRVPDTSRGIGAAQAYFGLCWFTALVYLPVVSVVRLLRRDPPQVVERKSAVVDIAARLGKRPVGDGEHWRLATLPGNQLFEVEFGTRTFRLDRLPPALDGLTVLHLTDLHLCGTPDRQFYREVIDLCMADGPPDVVAITGDVVDSHFHYRWILPLLGRLRWNLAAFAVLGNHDRMHDPVPVRRRLGKLGIQVLGNSWKAVSLRGETVVLIGQEEPWFRPGPDLSQCPVGPLRICLSHTPDHFSWARRNDIDLMLAGHVHGGQIRLPFIGSLFVPSRYSRRFDCGTFYAAPTLMEVSRGLAGREPLRYNCRPEVARITLRVSQRA